MTGHSKADLAESVQAISRVKAIDEQLNSIYS